MLTDSSRAQATLAVALALVLFLLGFALGWSTDDSGRALARAVPLAASPGAVEVARPPAAEPLPELRRTQAPRRPRVRTTTTAAQAAPAPKPEPPPPPPRRPAPKPVTIVGTG